MSRFKFIIITMSLIFILFFSCYNTNKPEIFANGIISTKDGFELNTTFTSDGKTVYFTRVIDYHRSPFMIYESHFNGIKWSSPEMLDFCKKYSNVDPFILPDGSKMYFVSNRPVKKGELKNDFDIWFVEREGKDWGEPRNLGLPINTEYNQFGVHLVKNGNMYFSTARKGSIGLHDIYYSELVAGKYTQPINLGDGVNTRDNEYDPAISPDEDFLVFTRKEDLYISFNKNGIWQEAKRLDDNINTSATEFRSCISPDKKHLYYTSTINGRGDIYRIKLKYLGVN